jgi:hypothetical protein
MSEEPIVYVSGGKLGDLIHQLSIINEMYLTTERKGILYLRPDHFNSNYLITYNDTYNLIKQQPYIEKYVIWNGEPYEIDLSTWRFSPLLYKRSLQTIFSSIYSIDWARSPWLFVGEKKPELMSKMLFCCSECPGRFPDKINFNKLFAKYGINNVLFITQTISEYNTFFSKTGIKLQLYTPSSIEDFVNSINSCALFIGNLSSPLTYAYALHKSNITLFNSVCYDQNTHFTGLNFMNDLEILIDNN